MPNLHFYAEQVVWQEVPGETSLAFTISGCPLGCKGCHSAQSWPATAGTPLTAELLLEKLLKYRGLISCVLFLGGEWQPKLLQQLLTTCKAQGLKTCLYTGLDSPPPGLLALLDYLKTGRWQAELGPLGTTGSNQRFYDLNLLQEQSWKFRQTEQNSKNSAATQSTTNTDTTSTTITTTATTKTTLEGLLPCND